MLSRSQTKTSLTYKLFSLFVTFTFVSSMCVMPTNANAQGVFNLPTPGTMVTPSIGYFPATMAGMTIHPENPLQLDFIITTGDDDLEGEAFKKESQKLINYFLATLTVPDEEMWVNLSPYEEDRIIADGLGVTEMGRDMLIQDYMLKQLTASLMYPEEELGNEFWKKVYAKSQARLGTTEIPTNTFNKVWIVPQEAVVYVNGTNVFISESHLKVMLEEDYLALESNKNRIDHGVGNADLRSVQEQEVMSEGVKEIVREVILPEIEREVNEGKTFANLRQIYNSMILATWYKQNLKESVLGHVYMDQNKIDGIDLEDTQVKEKVYNQYVEAFEKGVYNYIKEDHHPVTREMIPRKYFSGGLQSIPNAVDTETEGGVSANSPIEVARDRGNGVEGVAVNLNLTGLEKEVHVAASPVDGTVAGSSPTNVGRIEREKSPAASSPVQGRDEIISARLAEFRESTEAMPVSPVLDNQAIVLRGPGAVGLEVAKGLLRSGAKVLLVDIETQTENHRTIREELSEYFAKKQVALFLEDEIPETRIDGKVGTGKFTRKYVNLFAHYQDELRAMGITKESGIQGFIAASRFHSVRKEDVPTFKDIGIRWMAFVENDAYAGDKTEASRVVKEAGILAGVDFESNSGGVRGAMYGFVDIPIEDVAIRDDVSRIVEANLRAQQETGLSGHEIAQASVQSTIRGWGEKGLAFSDKLSYEESRADLQDMRQNFEQFKANHPQATMFDFLVREDQREANLKNPKRLDGVVLPNGVTVKVFAYQEDLPDNAEVQRAWGNHYAAFVFEHPDGSISALAQHLLVKLNSLVPAFDGDLFTIGGTRMDHFAGQDDLLRFVLEFAKEMTDKTAAAGIPAGGSKNGLNAPSDLEADSREVPDNQVERRNAFLIADARANGYLAMALGTGALLAQDLGLSKADVLLRHEQTVAYDRFGTTIQPQKVPSAPYSAREYNPDFGKDPGGKTAITAYAASVTTAIMAEGIDDPASSPVNKPGGIDFNPNNLDLQEQGQALDFTLDNSILQNLQPGSIHGIQPVIINITPITNFMPLLGKTHDDDGEQTDFVQLLGKLEDMEEQQLSQI